MSALGFECAQVEDPYAAAAELHRRPMVYRALVLSLAGLFREELAIVGTLKQRLPHVEIWLTHIEGRQAALAETMRMGADGLLDEDGVLHRTATVGPQTRVTPPPELIVTETVQPAAAENVKDDDELPVEDQPVLSAEELKALLAENPVEEESDAN